MPPPRFYKCFRSDVKSGCLLGSSGHWLLLAQEVPAVWLSSTVWPVSLPPPQLWTLCGVRLESLGVCRLCRKALRRWDRGSSGEGLRTVLSPFTCQLSAEEGKSRNWFCERRTEALPEPAPQSRVELCSVHCPASSTLISPRPQEAVYAGNRCTACP